MCVKSEESVKGNSKVVVLITKVNLVSFIVNSLVKSCLGFFLLMCITLQFDTLKYRFQSSVYLHCTDTEEDDCVCHKQKRKLVIDNIEQIV